MEPGKHNAKAIDGGFAVSSNGNQELVIEFQLTEGGETIYAHVYFTDATFDRSIESLRAMGWKGDNLSELEGRIAELAGEEVQLVIAEETYEGEQQLKIKWINALGGIRVKNPLTGNDLAAFGARMRDRIKAIDAAKPKNAAPAKPKAASVPAMKVDPSDDIPF